MKRKIFGLHTMLTDSCVQSILVLCDQPPRCQYWLHQGIEVSNDFSACVNEILVFMVHLVHNNIFDMIDLMLSIDIV